MTFVWNYIDQHNRIESQERVPGIYKKFIYDLRGIEDD